MYPEQGQYINIHAHRGPAFPSEWVLQNISASSYSPDDDGAGNVAPANDSPVTGYSVGLHPWDLERADVNQALKNVQHAAGNSGVLAIGETGLDRKIKTPIEFQEKMFRKQVVIAEKAALPVIVHAVKTYQELIGFVKLQRPAVPMIIHGFRGGPQLVGDLLRFGFMLSFGESLMKSEKVAAALREVPTGKFFLETDESDVPVDEIYAHAARIRSISIHELQWEQQRIFTEIFKKE